MGLSLLLFAAGSVPVVAHSWYTGHLNENGLPCCGDDDCRPLDDGDVLEVGGGYFIQSLALFVPFKRTQPSVDQHFHVCVLKYGWAEDNAPRCFFAPVPGS